MINNAMDPWDLQGQANLHLSVHPMGGPSSPRLLVFSHLQGGSEVRSQ